MEVTSIEAIRQRQSKREEPHRETSEERMRLNAEEYARMAREELPLVLSAALSCHDTHKAYTVTRQLHELMGMYLTLFNR